MDFTPILQAVIALLATVVTVVIIPYIKSKASVEQQKKLAEWIKIAVSAAEQIPSLTDGSDKKTYVIGFLESKGYSINTEDVKDEINTMIEAAVYQLSGTSGGGQSAIG